jgi:hypothetical protein
MANQSQSCDSPWFLLVNDGRLTESAVRTAPTLEYDAWMTMQ